MSNPRSARPKFVKAVWVVVWPKGTSRSYSAYEARDHQPIHGETAPPFYISQKNRRIQGSIVAVFDTKKEAESWRKVMDYQQVFPIRRGKLAVR